MSSPELLHPHALHVLVESDTEAATRFNRMQSEYPDARVWRVRGRKMATLDAAFDELGAALQVPYYFGENWSALDDCLNDFSWSDRRHQVVMITDAHAVLPGDDRAFQTLLRLLVGAAGEGSDAGTTFRTILQLPADASAAFWQRLSSIGEATTG